MVGEKGIGNQPAADSPFAAVGQPGLDGFISGNGSLY
jgi:hypothetical protein